jgi:hypothetical protein
MKLCSETVAVRPGPGARPWRGESVPARWAVVLAALLLVGGAVPSVSGGEEPSGKKKKDGAIFSIPIPVGHDGRGIKLPSFNAEGKLLMNFAIESAKRVDDNHLEMTNVQVETYADDGAPELFIDLTTAILDLNTRIVTSNEPTTVRRSDFEITGETMQFNTRTREGRFRGNVRMLIYNREEKPPSGETEKTQ